MESFSQSINRVDSLEKQLNSLKDDEQKMSTFHELTDALMSSDPDRANYYCDELISLSEATGNAGSKVDGLIQKAKIFRLRYAYDSSIIYFDRGIELAMSVGDERRLAELYAGKGHTLFRASGPKNGIEYYRKSYGLYKEVKDTLGIVNSLNGIGVMYMRMSDYDSAISVFLDMIRICEDRDLEEPLGKGYLNLGISFCEIGELERSSEYLLKSIPINEKLKHLSYIGIAYNNLGNITYDQGDIDGALEYYENGLDICLKINDKIGIANMYTNIGVVYDEYGDEDKALNYYMMAKSIYENIKDWNGFLIAYKNIGVIHQKNKEYEKALAIYDSCISIGQEINNLLILKETYINMAGTYELIGDFRNAVRYYHAYYTTKDSVYNTEIAQEVAELTLSFEKEKNQAMILSLENENLEKSLMLDKRTSQRNIYIITASGIILLLFFMILYIRQRAIKDRVIAQNRILQLEEEKKVMAAKTLIESHEYERKRIAGELQDSLGTILSKINMQFIAYQEKDPENMELVEKSREILMQAGNDVEKIAYNMMPGILTESGIFLAVDDLLDKVGETEGLQVKADLPETERRLAETKEIMVYRIIQELVNNTLKHAGAKNIGLAMQLHKDKLEVVYSDDGKGFNVEEKLESKSIGLQSIRSRVNFLNGKLTIDSAPGKGAGYRIEVPV